VPIPCDVLDSFRAELAKNPRAFDAHPGDLPGATGTTDAPMLRRVGEGESKYNGPRHATS